MCKARQMRRIYQCCSSGTWMSRQYLLLGARRPLTPQDPAPKPQPIIAQSADAHSVGSQALEQTALVCCQLVQVSSRRDGAALLGKGNFALDRKCWQLAPSGILLGAAWVTGRWRGEPYRNLAQSLGLCLHPAFLCSWLMCSQQAPMSLLSTYCPPLRHLDLWLVTTGITSIPYTCVGRFLSARLL